MTTDKIELYKSEQHSNQLEINTGNSTLLDSCAPGENLQTATFQAHGHIIRRPHRDEPFTRVRSAVKYAALIERREDSSGRFIEEAFFPVVGELQGNLPDPARPIAFHPCVAANGCRFIYPQKLDAPTVQPNSWNESAARLLSTPIGQWLKAWSDSEAQCYQFELVDPQMSDVPDYPDFAKDLDKALSPNIISSLDHPLIQRLLDIHSTVNDWEEVY